MPEQIKAPWKDPETSAQEYSARQIQICRVYFCLGVTYLETYFEKRSKMDHNKIDTADLDFSCREFPVRGLGVVITPPVCSGIDLLCASTRGAIQMYPYE